MDPGLRTFQTIYSEDEIRKVNINKKLVIRLRQKIDKLRSLRKSSKSIITIGKKLRNKVTEMHLETVTYLTKNYSRIYLPSFESQEMMKKMCSAVNRDFQTHSHYKFKMRMKEKCEERGVNLRIVTEEYTSKTCGLCGNIKYNLGSAKVYKCNKCNVSYDRDVNGARNILIKCLNEDICFKANTRE